MKSDVSLLDGAPAPDERGRRIEDWVEHWARLRPHAPALRAAQGDVSYGELLARADRIAAGLRIKGVRARDVVVVDIGRGSTLIEVILAVLRCGAVYSIVDVDWPVARYAEVLERTQAWLCVFDGSVEQRATGDVDPAVDVPRVDVAELRTARVSTTAPARGGSDAPCCVFFTSGSTGAPKGVLATHQAIIRIAREPSLGFGPGRRMLQTAPSPWDAFAMEVWCPLVSGGTVVIHSGRYLGPDDLRSVVRQGVNIAFLTTSLFNAIVDSDVQALAGVDTLVVGGERVSPAHLVRARDEVPDLTLFNGYGPVESTVFATVFPISEYGGDGDVPIGRPVPGTTICVLDDNHRPVAPGVVGEIGVAGTGLAIEYLDEPAATRAAFPLLALADGESRTRVYLTGDLGRVDERGQLRILGRRDRQFKIRGVRVEPGEIEGVLELLPEVSAAVVLPLPFGGPTVHRLVACVVGASGASGASGAAGTSGASGASGESGAVSAARIKDAVRAALPGGYVPDLVVPVAKLPLTVNGKVDLAELSRLAELAASDLAGSSTVDLTETSIVEAESGAPDSESDALADAVLAAVRELLGCELGPDTDIFDAGASSITAIRIAHRLGGLAGSKINPAQIFRASTPRGLTALVASTTEAALAAEAALTAEALTAGDPLTAEAARTGEVASTTSTGAVAVTTPTSSTAGTDTVGGRDTGAAAVPAGGTTDRSDGRWLADLPVPQWRFWYLETRAPGNGDGLTPLQHRITGSLDLTVLAGALRIVIGWHQALRTRLVRVGPRGVHATLIPAEDVPDVLTISPTCSIEDAHARVRDFLAQPIDLAGELPIRAIAIPVGQQDHLLALSVHHTAFDGWSGAIFCRDLSAAYESLIAGQRPTPRVPSDYRAAWLAQDLRENATDRAELWDWTRELIGVPDLPLGAGQLAPIGPVGEVWVDVPDALRLAAERRAGGAGGTFQAALLAAWVRALRRFTGASDFAIGIPVAGRIAAEVADVIGCFTSAVAVRFQGEEHSADEDLRAAVRQLSLALRFQYMPMERLLKASPPRDHRRNPFCQAGFVVQNYDAPRLDIGGAHCDAAIPQHDRSAFELTLELWLDRGLGARIWFRRDVLDADRAQSLAAQWMAELAEVAGLSGPEAAAVLPAATAISGGAISGSAISGSAISGGAISAPLPTVRATAVGSSVSA